VRLNSAKYSKIAQPWWDTLYKIARENKIPAVKIEIGKNKKIIIRIPYSEDLTSKLQSLFGENLIGDPYFYLLPLQKELSIRKYSRRTIKAYIGYNRDFLLFVKKKPGEIKNEDVKKYLYHMVENKGVSTSTLNIIINALKFYYGEILGLRDCIKVYRPSKWLFERARKGKNISTRTVQEIFRQMCKKAGINKDVTVHSLRHSFATHLLESGVNLRYIQEILGHKSSKTTEIYTHVSEANIASIKSPLDTIFKEEQT